MTGVVLDASAVLALLNNEPGAEAVAVRITGASISAVNYAEVYSRLSDLGLDGSTCRGVLAAINLRVVPFDEAAAANTGDLRASTRRHGLSLGDRACLSLVQSLDGIALTADRNWKRVGLDIEIELIR
jgi:ribonuclease VapC